MKKYKVSFYYVEHGTTEIQANSEQDAEAQVKNRIEINGLEDLKEVNIFDRDYDTVEAQEVE